MSNYSLLDASVSSIVTAETKRELVNADAILGLNAYVFDRYGTSTKVDHLSGRVFSRQLDLIAERVTGEAAVVVRRETSELGESMTLDVRAPGCCQAAQHHLQLGARSPGWRSATACSS